MQLEKDEQLSLLDDFISETTEHLMAAEERLLRLEANPGDAVLARELLRSFHTIKGNSLYFDFREMADIAHGLESLLTPVQDGLSPLPSGGMTQLLTGLDRIRTLMREIVENRNGPTQAEAPPEEEALETDDRYLIFEVNGLRMAVPLDQVAEVTRPTALAPLPHVPAYIAGLVNLRGVVVPMVDLHRRLWNQESASQARHLVVVPVGRGRVAMAVDRVVGVFALDGYEEQVTSERLLGQAANRVRYLDGAPVALLDLAVALGHA